MKLVKVQLNEAIAGVTESYCDGEIISVSSEYAERLVEQGTANYFVESEEVKELKEEIENLKNELKKAQKGKKK